VTGEDDSALYVRFLPNTSISSSRSFYVGYVLSVKELMILLHVRFEVLTAVKILVLSSGL
jgi:hypothetical protein